jgi:hypothetical protein
MMCASTTWFVDNSAREMKAASRSLSLRKVLFRMRILGYGVPEEYADDAEKARTLVTRQPPKTSKGLGFPKPFMT